MTNTAYVSLFDVIDNPAEVRDETVVSLWNVSPGSFSTVNPNLLDNLRALEARAPLGWVPVQLDGIMRYDLLISSRTEQQILDENARHAGFASNAALIAEITASDSQGSHGETA